MTAEEIMDIGLEFYPDMNKHQVWKKGRADVRISRARSILMYVMRAQGCTYTEIGQVMGKNHTSVMYAVGQVAAVVEDVDRLTQKVEEAGRAPLAP